MIIDCHTHIRFGKQPEFLKKLGIQPFSVATLLRRMDRDGIDRSVLLPLTNPENVDILGAAGNLECIEAARKHPDRLTAFCGIDPRNMLNTPEADLSRLIRIYRDMGCRGIGEMCAALPITDPLYWNLFHHAGECGMPILFHFTGRRQGGYGVIDRFHLPGLEAALKAFPKTVFIGHAMAFWAEFDGNLKPRERETYPKGPVKSEGRLWHLLAQYPNLYGDLSAGSGHNAISRDPEAGYRFLGKFHRQLLYGTDRTTAEDKSIPPQLAFLKDAVQTGKITSTAYANIMGLNFQRVALR